MLICKICVFCQNMRNNLCKLKTGSFLRKCFEMENISATFAIEHEITNMHLH